MADKPDRRAQLEYLEFLEKQHDKNALRRLLNAFTVALIVRILFPFIFDLVSFDSTTDFILFFPEAALDSAIFTIINVVFSAIFFNDSVKEQCRIDELRKQIDKDVY